MQPRVHRTNAGRAVAFLRRPSPSLRLEPSAPSAEGQDGAVPGGVGAADGGPSLEDLRRAVARIEGRLAATVRLGVTGAGEAGGKERQSAGADRLPLGVPAFDGLFAGGGLPLATLTELRCEETRGAGVATGFLTALVARLSGLRRGPVLWVREGRSIEEAGRVAALGLLHLGLDPSRLVLVTVRQPAEALWAIEEGLGCPGLSAVVGEVQGLPKALDLTASRRLALRARAGGVPMLLSAQGAPEAASAAMTRLLVEPVASRAVDGFEGGPGFPAFRVTVEKNRGGRTGVAFMEWNSDERRFLERRPVPVDLAVAPTDRQVRPDAAGQIVAHPGAGRRLFG